MPRSRVAGSGTANLAVIASDSTRLADGIRDYARCLVGHLRSEGALNVELVLRQGNGSWRNAEGAVLPHARCGMPRSVEEADFVLLQYNPFWYGRRGFAPAVPAMLWRLRSLPTRPVIGIMVHETFVDPKNWRWALMGAWQRLQLLALQGAVDVQLCSIERWSEKLRRMWPGKEVHHLPVASNLPDMRARRVEARASLGVDPNTTVLACFGLRHPGRIQEHVLRAKQAVARAGRRVIVLNLGASSSGDASAEVAGVRSPGYLDEEELACLLSSADVFLAPYLDGVSTRRTTVMAALQHGIPVVGTNGHLTDRVLAEARDAMILRPVDRAEQFAEAVAGLAVDDERRINQGEAGRRLYVARFDWPVIAHRLIAVFEHARQG